MSQLLDLYKNWKKVINGTQVNIPVPGAYIAGTENKANEQEVDFIKTQPQIGYEIGGFKKGLSKGEAAGFYPTSDDILNPLRKGDAVGSSTNDWNNKYTTSFRPE